MALIERQVTDQIEVVESNHIQVRIATIIEKDGVELSRSNMRYVLAPGDDTSFHDPKVQAIANAIWTEEVITAYQESLSDRLG